MKNPWDIRPASSHGDFDDKGLFESIGRALSEWENIENSCAELFAVFVLTPYRNSQQAPAIRAYGSVVSFRGRCDMLRAASAAYFHAREDKKSKFEERLDSLIGECLEFSNRRNEIAHGRVVMLHLENKEIDEPLKPLGFYILPSFYNPKKYKMDQTITYQYVSNDAIYYRQEFTKLHLRLEGLRADLIAETPQTLQ